MYPGGGSTHPHADTPQKADPSPGCRSPSGHVTCDACLEANPPPLWIDKTCESITLPLTSFAGGKHVSSFYANVQTFWLDQ